MSKSKIAVIGAGLMGHGIAQVFLAGGHNVAMHDTNNDRLESAHEKISDILSLLKQDAEQIKNLSLHQDLAEAVKNADLVIEAGPEKLEIKQAIFKALSEHTKPTAILATNTSAMPIKTFSEVVENPSRVVGMHFWNPPYLVRLVEVVQASTTSEQTIAETIAMCEAVALKPVHVKKDIPGFIGNRLQHAMKREAIAMIADGVCDAETIDTVVKNGFGARLAVLGPMEQSDMVGLNLTLDIYKTLFPTLDNTSEPPQLLVDKVVNGELGMKSGRGFRDWTPASAEAVKNRLRDYLLQTTKKTNSKQ